MLNRLINIAPMMGYTDRHFRVLMRSINRNVLLYTEMVTSSAILQGDREKLLRFSEIEHPIAIQLGGSDPKDLASCARLAQDVGYDEVNLNVGCPSNRVQAGRFGACLMKEPEQVAECVAAMKAAVRIPVTVKTRIGVDDLDSYSALYYFIGTLAKAGCEVFIIHARKAWLKGLNPKQNRNIPPLCYEFVYQLKNDFPHLKFILNGGIKSLAEIKLHSQLVDGVMIGRAACSNPYLFAVVDRHIYGMESKMVSQQQIIASYLPYMIDQFNQGVPLRALSRHLGALWYEQEGAKYWRHLLNDSANAKHPWQLIDKIKEYVNL